MLYRPARKPLIAFSWLRPRSKKVAVPPGRQQGRSAHFRQELETLLREMMIETEGGDKPEAPHCLETHAVDKAQVAPRCDKKRVLC
jgi:hypothetical protein